MNESFKVVENDYVATIRSIWRLSATTSVKTVYEASGMPSMMVLAQAQFSREDKRLWDPMPVLTSFSQKFNFGKGETMEGEIVRARTVQIGNLSTKAIAWRKNNSIFLDNESCPLC